METIMRTTYRRIKATDLAELAGEVTAIADMFKDKEHITNFYDYDPDDFDYGMVESFNNVLSEQAEYVMPVWSRTYKKLNEAGFKREAKDVQSILDLLFRIEVDDIDYPVAHPPMLDANLEDENFDRFLNIYVNYAEKQYDKARTVLLDLANEIAVTSSMTRSYRMVDDFEREPHPVLVLERGDTIEDAVRKIMDDNQYYQVEFLDGYLSPIIDMQTANRWVQIFDITHDYANGKVEATEQKRKGAQNMLETIEDKSKKDGEGAIATMSILEKRFF